MTLKGTYQNYSTVTAIFEPAGDPPQEQLLEYQGKCRVTVQGATYYGKFLLDFDHRRCAVEWLYGSGGNSEHAISTRHASVLAAFTGRYSFRVQARVRVKSDSPD